MEPSVQARSLPQSGFHATLQRVGAKAHLSPVPSAIRNVINCADDGSVGTLRQVVAVAADNDYIDLSGLGCSSITLQSGEISTARNGLTLHGPTDHALTIATATTSRLLHHTGTGSFTIDHLVLSGGKYTSSTGSAKGGCVNSSGGVNLYSSTVIGCTVSVMGTGSFPAYADGGGIYAARYLATNRSQIFNNQALAFDANHALGGGAVCHGLYGGYSTLSGNTAVGVTSGSGIGTGGALVVAGSVYLSFSTIDSNQADVAAGIYQSGTVGDQLKIRNSTISGNKASGLVGGIYALSPLHLDNSTVAFNSANSDAAIDVNASVIAYSSIIAKNSVSTGAFADLYVAGAGSTLTGSHNLIVSSNLGLSGTLTANPRLVPLANHGGLTRTHALLPLSPAVDQGSTGTTPLLFYDQRGSGFSREVPSFAPDIGAYERQVNDDEIFYDGVE